MSRDDLKPAMELFERRVEESERTMNENLRALNLLRKEAGLPPRLAGQGSEAESSSKGLSEIKSDTFFGKRQQTAVREYLEMRKSGGADGPAKPREIYDALISGGYVYDAKEPETALVGLRAMLRKRSNVFVKIGESGKYGLRTWYPDLKKPDEDKTVDDDAGDAITARGDGELNEIIGTSATDVLDWVKCESNGNDNRNTYNWYLGEKVFWKGVEASD